MSKLSDCEPLQKRDSITPRAYVKSYCCCCMFDRRREDPAIFDEENIRYRAFFGTMHIRQVLVILAIIKTILVFSFLFLQVMDTESPLGVFSATFAFLTVCITNILLVAGVRLKRYIFLIPYFTVCVLFIFILILHLFVDFLDTANSKNTVEIQPILHNTVLLFMICFEVYMLSVVWRAFVYICDFNMQRQIEKIVKKKSMVKRSFDIEYDLVRNEIIRAEVKANEEFV
ncbi:hypothetical protein CRE_10869 [Caenorhabditis remanei]|uniref:Uncharacterized protein n=2 Tax=Caenorhabditis remanei TaxID=31234 RepID=E3M595_CAERE|nr:hypothetical protein CRE_10869 [Caenorhabditis remanei]